MNHPLTPKILLRICWLAILASVSYTIQAQGLKGTVVDQSGEPLPFASIGVAGSSQGTAANIEGQYQLTLTPGKYHIRVLYLGFSQLDTTLNIGSGYSTFKAVMRPESVALPEAIVSAGNEDPAYTIMRRAIAKAKYHSMQVDEYDAKVYVKGSGRLLKTPWLFRKQINKALAEEGIDSSVAFTQESISKLHYTRPDQYRDTVISVRTVGSDNNTSPMGFIYSSFYEPKVVNGISPLAPDAFVHYKFEYLGYIVDGNETINKIKVTPRGKGDNVFEGVIYIVDQAWSIYSLDLTTYVWGIQFNMQQRFDPLKPDVWLPVHEIYNVNGNVFGFGFEYRYFAQLSDYKITLNPDLEVPVLVLDSKKDKEESAVSDAKFNNQSFESGLGGLNPNEELSTKQLRKMLKEYEKQEIESLPEVDTITISNSSNSQVIDSSAYKRDSSYWKEVRPMPLTDYEVKGYERQDSIAKIPPELRKDKDEDDGDQDTLSIKVGDEGFQANVRHRSKFKIEHLITGGGYSLGDKAYLKLKGPLQSINYNTVDGFHAGYELEFGNTGKQKLKWSGGPGASYNIARESVEYEGKLRFYGNDWSVRFNGGRQTQQFNWNYPMSEWSNSLYSLLANRNYLKEYQKDFFRMEYEQNISTALGFNVAGEYADRTHLSNFTDLVFFDDKKISYTSNDPVHLESQPGDLADHKALISDLEVWARPFWKYQINNGTKRKDYRASPKLTIGYRKGWNEDYDPFDMVRANFEYRWLIGAGSVWSMNLGAGKFIGDNKPAYFADYMHFPGNRLIATPLNPVNAFRMLDYYAYSTNDQYAFALFNYQFRRLALTQFDFFRRSGIRENFILNTLLTPQSQQYGEIGYGVNYILRVLRVEFVTSWQDFKYQDFAIRFGVATDFKSIFGG